jgi:hypothetical protein
MRKLCAPVRHGKRTLGCPTEARPAGAKIQADRFKPAGAAEGRPCPPPNYGGGCLGQFHRTGPDRIWSLFRAFPIDRRQAGPAARLHRNRAPSLRLGSGQQRRNRNPQRPGQQLQRAEGDVPLATLNRADVSAMKTAGIRQRLLRQAVLASVGPNIVWTCPVSVDSLSS